MADKDKDEQEKTIAEGLVVYKYVMAGEISNCVIQGVIAQCVAGASVRDLCSLGDRLLLEETVKVFKKEKDMKKGIAFPTCLSVNNCVCSFSPLASDTDVQLKDGDVVKIDLGAHVDGFIASVAHTVVVGSSPSTKIAGRKADILLAAHYASEAAFRLMKHGTENQAVTNVVQTIAESFKCKPITGMLSHQLKQFEINGGKTIIQNPNENQRKEHEKSTFQLHEVYAIDVLISSGEGMTKGMDSRATVYKKTNETYVLKNKASNALFIEVNSKCGTMPFCLRNLEDEEKACVGVRECVSHKLLEPFPVLFEKPNEIVARFKFTVLLTPNGPQKITGLPFDPTAFQTDNSIIDEKVKKLITSSTRSKPNKKKPATTEVKKAEEKGNKPTRLMGILKLEDAHLAGTSESIDCTLFLTEGDSVKAVVVSGLEKIGYDKNGVFPLGRKLLNVRVATSEQIAKNLEVNNLMKILGLEYGKKYDTVEDLKSLRYGRLVIMTDPDPDGAQFKGLIINFLHYNWPSLLRLPFLQQFVIPIVKATKGIGELAESLTFFSLDEFEQWKTQTENWRHYHIKHYKGLETLRKEEVKECFSNLQRHQIDFRHGGDDDDRAISMAFNNKHLEEWRYRLNVWKNACKDLRQLGFSGDLYAKDIKEVSYHDFVKKDLIRFRNMEYVRSVPSIMDGFNERQRKTLYTCIKRDDKEEINVAQLAVSVAENCAYYQPDLLIGTITGLAQDFVGSNNINLLIPNGQFASRHLESKDVGSPDYIFTMMSKITRKIFHPRDDPLLKYRTDGNQSIEPEYFAPIIPMVLVNGANGIGTGFKTKIPKQNPREIIENLKRMLNGEKPNPMDPWFKGYRGTVERIDQLNFVISGELAVLSPTTIEITELPVDVPTENYKKSVLEKLLCGSEECPPIITDYQEHHTDNSVRFVVTMTEKMMQQVESEGFHRAFKLQSVYSLRSMLLYDSNGSLKTYNSVDDIMNEFYEVRLELYRKRRDYFSGKVEALRARLVNQNNFLTEISSKVLIVDSEKKFDVLLEELRRRNYAPDPLIAWEKKSNCDVDVANVGCYQYLHQLPIRFQTNEGKQAYLAKKIKEIRECELLSDPSPEDLWRRDLEELLVILNEAEVAEQENLALIAETTPSPHGRRIDPSDVKKAIASPIVSSNDRNRAPTYDQQGIKKNPLSEEPKASGSGRASKEDCPAKSTKGAARKPKSADDDMVAFKSPVKKPRLQ